ncbi:hypothetical protein O1611_g4262 [Lasiodiplodia mahajangana]|uniref:Uncharacterized protein n=1 Tax=Lasiodiplodia mahajangana TaxID=1108764 RepID=A0ACC2JPD8_9PEZI|nr:hypothetical protein O1611_g4262 [Lasiodiplodia mahajangana]
MASLTDSIPTAVSLPASITSPPTLPFVPPPECNDPSNHWIVTTSCYIEDGFDHPNWLTCTISDFGAPSWYDPSCHIPGPTEAPYYQDAPKITVDGVVSYYAGCPVGYSTARTTANPGYFALDYTDVHFDATAYNIQCCPTQYDFQIYTEEPDTRKMTSTIHNGVTYPLFIYPLPACAATSIQQLSGKEIPVQTWSNDMAWDKRKRQVQTIPWDYEHGTMFAHQQQYDYTVFHGTHTCFEYCSDWFTYCKRIPWGS